MLCMKAENDNKKGFTLPYGEYSFDQWYYWVKTASEVFLKSELVTDHSV